MVKAAEWQQTSNLASRAVSMKTSAPGPAAARTLAIEEVRSTLVRAQLTVGWEGHATPDAVFRYLELAQMWCVRDPAFSAAMSNEIAVEQRLRGLWREIRDNKDGYWQGKVPIPDEMLRLLKLIAQL